VKTTHKRLSRLGEENPYREVDMKTMDSPVVEQIKPAAQKAAKKTGTLLHSFSFDPHPTRTKIITGLRFGIPMFFSGAIAAISWMRRKG